MSGETETECWVLVVRVHDAPGALTAIASVFSSRGVSLEMILGNGVSAASEGGSIVLTFHASERKKETLLRVVRRLEKVVDVVAYRQDAHELKAVAVVRLTDNAELPQDLPVHAELLTSENAGRTFLLSGSAQSVDDALTTLRHAGLLSGAMVSVMAV